VDADAFGQDLLGQGLGLAEGGESFGQVHEAGGAQPTLDVLRRLAIALSVSADQLVFDTDERGPDDDLRLHLEAISHLDDDEKHVVRTVIESVLLRHEARRYTPAAS
jgi:hypothetical protein